MALSRFREAIVPVYLFLALLLGGSAQGIWVNAILQLLGLMILAWVAMARSSEPLTRPARRLISIALLALLVVGLQLIPMPPSLWTALPGRDAIAGGYKLLGIPAPWLPLSLAPDETLSTLLRLLPPIAILAAMLQARAYRPAWLMWALTAGTFAGVVLGTLQVSSGGGPESPWYLYPISNFGTATGFFANGNHMAILLVATIPFLSAALAAARGDRSKQALQRRTALQAVAAGLLLVVMLGLALNGSLAGFGLGIPVLVASAILLLPPGRQRRWLIAPLILLVIAVGAIVALPLTAKLQSLAAVTSVESRREVAATSWAAARDFMPTGSGLGSFEKVYRQYEDLANVDPVYVNHAHNDYLELAVETGVPGLIVLLLFLLWWLRVASGRWTEGRGDPYAKAAVIASAAILAHSFVDFPLRTEAIASLFAVTLALMAQSRLPAETRDGSELWPARHLEIR